MDSHLYNVEDGGINMKVNGPMSHKQGGPLIIRTQQIPSELKRDNLIHIFFKISVHFLPSRDNIFL